MSSPLHLIRTTAPIDSAFGFPAERRRISSGERHSAYGCVYRLTLDRRQVQRPSAANASIASPIGNALNFSGCSTSAASSRWREAGETVTPTARVGSSRGDLGLCDPWRSSNLWRRLPVQTKLESAADRRVKREGTNRRAQFRRPTRLHAADVEHPAYSVEKLAIERYASCASRRGLRFLVNAAM